ncbi:MAG: hypothetical protein JNK37_04340 [Verrucomicrobiales bacterium]|nr:hypothetical protein [Verrucomicrobiales bacterium]
MNSVTPIDSGDPRLTAYVLGELSVAESHAVEAWLLKSPEARAEVQGIREMVSLIRGGFAEQLTGALSAPAPAPQPVPTFTVVRPAAGSGKARIRPVVWGTGLAAAAAVALALTSPRWLGQPAGGSAQPVAAAETTSAPAYSGAIPGLSPVGEAGEGVYLASAGGVAPDFRPRHLAGDPVITEVRFLPDDPTQLRNFPLTPEMVSYLPAQRVLSAAPATADGHDLYLDTERFPQPEIVENPVGDWQQDDLYLGGIVSPVMEMDSRTTEAVAKATGLKDAGRQLFLAKEYEAAAVLFQQALDELPKVGTDGALRTQIEALLAGARKMADSRQ